MNTQNGHGSFANNVVDVKDFISDGEALGVTMPAHLKRKLDKAEQEAQSNGNGRVKVALVGGFSVGKTSIVASWLGEFKANMKIGVGESSNEVETYKPNETYEIIDTPGLYGHKKELDGVKEREAYKEKTRRYVSEAHVLLYVLDSTNPIKESHKDELNWLFRQLALLPRTIFVLSRFDNIVDMGDEEEYQESFITKKNNIIDRLKDTIGLTDAEASTLPVVAVSAAPDDKSVDDWLKSDDRKTYESLSHMQLLRDAIDKKVEQAGGYEALMGAANAAMLRDVLLQPLGIAKSCGVELKEKIAKLTDVVSKEKNIQDDVPSQIKHTSSKTLEDIKNIFDHLRQDIKSSTSETLQSMLERRLGATGDRLEKEVKSIYESQVEPVRREIWERMTAIPDMEPILLRYKTDMDEGLSLKGEHTIEFDSQKTPWMTIVDQLTSFMGNEQAVKQLSNLLGIGVTGSLKTAAESAKQVAAETGKQAAKRFAGQAAKKTAGEAAKKAAFLGRMTSFMAVVGPMAGIAADWMKDQKEKAKLAEFNEWKDTVQKSLMDSERSLEEQMGAKNFFNRTVPYWDKFVEISTGHRSQLKEAQEKLTKYSLWLQRGEKLEQTLTY